MTRKTIASLPEDSQGIVRLVRSLAVGLVIALLILGAAVVGTYLRGENTRNIITRSACAEDPAGQECAKVRAETALHEPIRNSCIPYQRVTSRRGRNCPKFYVPPGAVSPSQFQAAPNLGNGGVGEQGSGGSGGGSGPVADGGGDGPAPAPGEGGSDPQAPGQGGSGGGSAPADPSPATSPVVQPPPVAEPEPEPSKNVLAPTLEGVQNGAGEVVGGVGGTVETVGCKLEGTC